MDKMKMKTANNTLKNLAKLKQMFPEVITETKDDNGNIVSTVDAKKLEQLLSTKVIDGGESYDFTWVGKKQAIVEASTPIRKTLRPCKKDSVNWDKTENLYIEGDNLDVLKLLQESYLNKVKMIYIDPPYNTGNDFIYNDNFTMEKDEYEEGTDLRDEEGNKQFTQNSDSNPRFHSDWCSMMYPRLKLARNLLTDDGVIFISIDDHEVDNLRKICDEVFGQSNKIPSFIVESDANKSGDEILIQSQYEYALIYAKNKNKCIFNKVDPVNSEDIRALNDAPTPLLSSPGSGYTVYYNPETGDIVPEMDYDKNKIGLNKIEEVYTDNISLLQKGYKIIRPGYRNGNLQRWRWSYETFLARKEEIIITPCQKGYKIGFRQVGFNTPGNIWNISSGTVELKKLFERKIFDNPKSTTLLDRLLKIATSGNSTILDFFSGSATTAHAVMQLNAEDGGHRKFIMVQLPEICDEKSEAFKAGYKNICEIGKERIRRAGNKIVEETGKKDLDIGFRVLKLDDSNMKDVYYNPEQLDQKTLLDAVENIKPDRTPEDLLYACMLEWGLELSLPHEVKQMGGYNVHVVNENELIACFDKNVNEDTIKAIADMKPLRVVFRDHSFENDAARINVEEIFKLKSPNTDVKVI